MYKNPKNVYLMYAISFFEGMVVYAAISTLYRQARGLDLSEIAFIELFSYVFALAFEIPFGFIADRIGYKKTFIISEGIYFISKIVFLKADSFVLFFLERFLLSAAIAGLSGLDASILYLSSSKEESHKVSGIYSGFGTAGMLCGSLIFTFFLSSNYDGCAIATAVAYGIAFILSFFIDEVKEEEKEEKMSYKRLSEAMKITLKDTKFIIFLIGVALISQLSWNVSVMLDQIRYVELNIEPSLLGVIAIILSGVGMLSAYSADATKKLGFRNFVLIMCLILAVSTIVMGYTGSLFVCFVTDALMSLGYYLIFPLLTSLQNKRVTIKDRATQLSCYAMITDIGCMSLEALTSFVAAYSNTALFIMCSVGFVLAYICIRYCYND
ncbi:MAG: MFS transporter [Erysipelotrichaceae bacterium]|nr:MFS transporter [Erysipelotrichaceae bacterium]